MGWATELQNFSHQREHAPSNMPPNISWTHHLILRGLEMEKGSMASLYEVRGVFGALLLLGLRSTAG